MSVSATAPRTRASKRGTKQLLTPITMRDIDPPIWRLVTVPDAFTLHQFHRVLQIVFSRLDYHLFAFELGARRFEMQDPAAEYETEDAASTALRHLDLRAGSEFRVHLRFRRRVDSRHSRREGSPDAVGAKPRFVAPSVRRCASRPRYVEMQLGAHHYRNTVVLARVDSRWRMVGVLARHFQVLRRIQ